jgi:hypothetical protein
MKGYVTVLFLCLVLGMISITTADIPSLVGNWTGPFVEYDNQTFSELDAGIFYFNITEQKDRIFSGYSSYVKPDGTQLKTDMAGVISADGTELSVVEQNNGYSNGKILGPDAFELTYLSDKNPISVAVDQFIRIK